VQAEAAPLNERLIDRAAVPETTELDPSLASLIQAAGGLVGLNVLLLFGHDPTTCDTAHGLARRLQFPVSEVSQALTTLADSGVIRYSQRPGASASASLAYWLSEDAVVFRALSRLIKTYCAGPGARRALFRALPS
jgi:hypothetical protein